MADYLGAVYPLPQASGGILSGRSGVLSTFTPAGATDTTAPTCTVVSPPVGSNIASTDALIIDVTDETALGLVVLTVGYPGATRITEVVWDRDEFVFPFLGSSRTAVAGGHRYTIVRTNGWQASPAVNVYAVDSSGNQPAEP